MADYSKAEYISRKVMDCYMDKMTIRLNRLWKRIVAVEGECKLLRQTISKHHLCEDPTCKYCTG